MDAFNVWNHTQFSGINATLNAPNLTGAFTNIALNTDGTINNKNGFGSVNGVRPTAGWIFQIDLV